MVERVPYMHKDLSSIPISALVSRGRERQKQVEGGREWEREREKYSGIQGKKRRQIEKD